MASPWNLESLLRRCTTELRLLIRFKCVTLRHLTKEGILLFDLPNRGPEEDGGRDAKVDPLTQRSSNGDLVWCRVLVVSPALWRLRER